MKRMRALQYGTALVIGALLRVITPSAAAWGQPSPAAVAAFDAYDRTVEARLARQHAVAGGFLAVPAGDESRLRGGGLIVESVAPSAGPELPGALLHHWRGTVFVPGAGAAEFERMLRDFAGYPRRFAPEVLRASVTGGGADRMQVEMRVRQKHVVTVVLDSTYDVRFGRLDARHGFSVSRSTRVAEIDGADTSGERALTAAEEHGFLWRQNTYWSYAERDEGLYIQVESVSLSRAIPRGLGWAVGPFVEKVPRESLEFTLRAVRNGLRPVRAAR